MSKSIALIFISIIVGLTLVYAFMNGGSPTAAKNKRFDSQRIQHLQSLKNWVNSYYQKNKTMPTKMSDLSQEYNNQRPLLDPETKAEYSYQSQSGTQYQLCTTFATNTTTNQQTQSGELTHPAGYYCFSFDASKY